MKEDEAEMGVQSEGCGDRVCGERVAPLGWVVREVLREDGSGGRPAGSERVNHTARWGTRVPGGESASAKPQNLARGEQHGGQGCG